MARSNINVRGISTVIRNLQRKYGRQVLDIAKQELKVTALTDVETYAKERLTKDSHVDTGRLRTSIHTETQGNQIYTYSDRQGRRFDGGLSERIINDKTVKVGTNVVYAGYIERLDPYMRAGYMNGRKKIKKNIQNAVRRALR